MFGSHKATSLELQKDLERELLVKPSATKGTAIKFWFIPRMSTPQTRGRHIRGPLSKTTVNYTVPNSYSFGAQSIRLIVGLSIPSKEYDLTRHNVGYGY